MTTKLNKQIISLRKKGLTYNQIANKLKCSKSTVSYALNSKTRRDALKRQQDTPLHIKQIRNKIYKFLNSTIIDKPKKAWYIHKTPRQIKKAISDKAARFQRPMTFNYKDVYKLLGDNFNCALTGRPLQFNNPDTYEYDHIMPTSRGGDNSINNLQIVCPEANRAKQNLTDQEFLDLCKEVVIHAGFRIYKPKK